MISIPLFRVIHHFRLVSRKTLRRKLAAGKFQMQSFNIQILQKKVEVKTNCRNHAVVVRHCLFQDQMGPLEQQELAFVSQPGTIQVSLKFALKQLCHYPPTETIIMINTTMFFVLLLCPLSNPH